MEKIKSIVPGFLLAILIAFIATNIESALPIHLISGSVLALFIGMFINYFRKDKDLLSAGVRFTSKKILKFAIILLGASLNISTVLNVGKLSLSVMIFTLLTCFGAGYFIGKKLGLNWKLSNLISAGTGICGGSAIASISTVIDADDLDIAYAMSATFIFDMLMIILFPIMGSMLELSDMAYGLWAGTAVNDTSSVVAAGYAFSERAGDFATMVKLTRTLVIIPTVISFAIINFRLKQKNKKGVEGSGMDKVNLGSVVPWFIMGFVLLAIINSFGLIPLAISTSMKKISKFLMVAALGAIGLNTSLKQMKNAGPAPMLHGFIISALVVLVAIGVEYFMGIV